MSLAEIARQDDDKNDGLAREHGITSGQVYLLPKPSYEVVLKEFQFDDDAGKESDLRQQLQMFVSAGRRIGMTVRQDTVDFALFALVSIMKPRTPLPVITLSSLNGLRAEWHQHDIDLILQINAPYDCGMQFRDNRNPESGSSWKPVVADLGVLTVPIDLLTSRSAAQRPDSEKLNSDTKHRSKGTIDDFLGVLAGQTEKVLTIEEINEAIAAGWAGEESGEE